MLKSPVNLWDYCFRQLKSKPNLIIIDPIALFMEGSLIDFKTVALTLMRFNRWAKEHKTTLVALHHTTKQRADNRFLRPQDRVSGSGAFPGYSSTQCMIIEGIEEGVDYDKLIIVPHMTKKEEHRLIRKHDGYFAVLENNAQEQVLQAMEALKGIMPYSDFVRMAAVSGLTDQQISQWLEDDPTLRKDGDYVFKLKQ